MAKENSTPILIPLEAAAFWHQMRLIVREELEKKIPAVKNEVGEGATVLTGMTYKPLYSMRELQQLFGNVSRTTIYSWIEARMLQPRKLKGKIFFLWEEIEKLLKEVNHAHPTNAG